MNLGDVRVKRVVWTVRGRSEETPHLSLIDCFSFYLRSCLIPFCLLNFPSPIASVINKRSLSGVNGVV